MLVFMLLLFLCSPALAHEVRPAYLELHQVSRDSYDVLWKVPARGETLRLSLDVRFPDRCAAGEPAGVFSGGAHTQRWRIQCAGGLDGATVSIVGLSSTLTDVLVRVEGLDGATQIKRVIPANPSFIVEGSPGHWDIVRTYGALGVEHILTGVDHLLFVLALFIITTGGWKLVKTITAFTVAHSVTLSAATLGFVHVPQAPVEAVIALSIVCVAAEILRSRQGLEGITARAPWIVAFTFGLLHGFGFAGALSEVGLPQTHIPLALLFFNLGVEVGQLLFIGSILGLMFAARRVPLFDSRWVQPVSAYAIGSIAMFWLIQRIAAF